MYGRITVPTPPRSAWSAISPGREPHPSLIEDREAYYVALVVIHIRVYGLGMKSGDIIVALQKGGVRGRHQGQPCPV